MVKYFYFIKLVKYFGGTVPLNSPLKIYDTGGWDRTFSNVTIEQH